MSEIISPEPVTEWRPGYLPPYLSNGLIGLRLGKHPLASGVATLSGLVGIHPEDEIPTFAQAPYPIGLDIAINGFSMAEASQRIILREQRYDFSCGEIETRFSVAGEGANVEACTMVFCSRTQPTLVLADTTVRVDRDCELRLEALIDIQGMGRLIDRRTGAFGGFGREPIDGWMHWGVLGDFSTCGAAYVTEFAGCQDVTRNVDRGRACPLNTTYGFHAEPGREYRMRRIVSLVPDEMHSQPHLQAVRLVQAGHRCGGFDQIRQDNKNEWGRMWESRIMLAGAPSRWQRMADAAYFYLHTSTHESSPSSTSIFGLAYWPNYHYYRGHIMWDVDTFALPPLMFTNPDTVRGLLNFRYTRFPAAHSNAAMAGYQGMQYPWEASPDRGEESAPARAASPTVEHHVSMDVALAFARFVHATGDFEFAFDCAWPVLYGVAKWIASRVVLSERGYEFRHVNGPAETKTTVHNNAFVNMAAMQALREAASFGRHLGRGMPARWEKMADRIVLPFDAQRGIILNHDGYHPDEEKGETPEALAGFCPLGYMADPETERRTIDYYLQFADRYAGAPMLSALLGVYAAWTGDRGRALELFERGYADFIVEPFTITTEYSPSVYPDMPVAGPFGANIGGFLIACLYGLPGIHQRNGTPASWCRRPVVLPQGWDAIHVDRVWGRGEPMSLVAEHGADRARLPA